MAMMAATMVSGAATPAVMASSPKPKKKLIAGPMLAIVAAEMSMIPSTPRCSRCSCPTTPTGGLLLSPSGRDSELLIAASGAQAHDQVARP